MDTMTKQDPEATLAGLKVGDYIQSGANGRWSTPAKIVRIDPPAASGYGGTFRNVEWQSGTGNGTIGTCIGSRDLGRFWRVG